MTAKLAQNQKWGRDLAPGDVVYLDGEDGNPIRIESVSRILGGKSIVAWGSTWAIVYHGNTYQVEPE